MKRRLILFLSLIATTGCATLFNSEVKAVGMYSSPMGAEVWVNGTMHGRTPLSVELGSQTSQTVVFKKEGHSDVECKLGSELFSRWLLADFVRQLVAVLVSLDS